MEFDRREQELICQVEELQLDVHRLNNMVNPILLPAPAVEEDPNVLVAEVMAWRWTPRMSLKRRRLSLLRMTTVMVCPTSTVTTPRSSLAIVSS